MKWARRLHVSQMFSWSRFRQPCSPASLVVFPQNLTTTCNFLIYPEEGDSWLSVLVNEFDHDLNLWEFVWRVYFCRTTLTLAWQRYPLLHIVGIVTTRRLMILVYINISTVCDAIGSPHTILCFHTTTAH